MRSFLRAPRRVWRAYRFWLWALRLRLAVRRAGGRARIERLGEVSFDAGPHVKAKPSGEGGATTTIRIGDGVELGRGMTIDIWAGGDNLLEIGAGTSFENNTRLQVYSGSLRIEAGCEFRDGVKLKSAGELLIEEGAIIGHNSTVHCAERVHLGPLVGLAELVSILDSDHAMNQGGVFHQAAEVRTAPVDLGRNVFVARGGTVLKGARIGDNAVVAANAVVTAGDYESGWILGGVPAKALQPLPPAPVSAPDRQGRER